MKEFWENLWENFTDTLWSMGEIFIPILGMGAIVCVPAFLIYPRFGIVLAIIGGIVIAGLILFLWEWILDNSPPARTDV